MKKILTILLFLFSFQTSQAQTFNSQLATMLQDTLEYYVSIIPTIKGMSASVYLSGQGLWQGAAGISYQGNPVSSDMEFGIASNTKLFVASAMLNLQENNILDLDDALYNWLPAYPNIDSTITIRQLLNHSSGISDPLFGPPYMDTINNNPTRVFTPTEVLGWVGTPYFPAGTSWGYSNINYVLAGMIAENATGYSIAQLIRDSILTPLSLDSTFSDVAETVNGAIAHRWWNGIDYHDTSRVGLNTAAGCAGFIFSTSAEMAQWYNALFSGQVLSPSSLAELTDFIPTTGPDIDYGLGLHRQTTLGLTYWGHGGSTWGYRSKIIYDTCMTAVVCGLSNSFPSGQDGVTFLLYQLLVDHLPACPASIAGPSSVCRGESGVTYTVPSIDHATSYVWSLPSGATGTSNTNSITADFSMSATTGNVTVKGINAFGESAVSVFPVTVDSVDTGVTLNFPVISANAIASSYQWLDCNSGHLPIAGATDQNYTATANGNYAVLVTQGSCSDTSACVAIMNVGLETISENKIRITPNPFSETLTIRSNNFLRNASLTLKNYFGYTVRQLDNLTGQTIVLHRDQLPAGLYFLRLTQEGKTIATKKLVIRD